MSENSPQFRRREFDPAWRPYYGVAGVGAVMLIFGVVLTSSTCTVAGCGSAHSSIWPRLALLLGPLGVVAVQSFRLARSKGGSGLAAAVALPWLVCGTVVSAWAIAYAPTTAGSGGGQSDSMAMPLIVAVNLTMLLAGWTVVLALIGIRPVWSAILSSAKRWAGALCIALSCSVALAFSWAVAATSAFGATGVDIAPHTNAAASGANAGTAQTAHVEISQCTDARMLHCWRIAKDVREGDSFDLAPGVYTIENNAPAGQQCAGTTPTPFQLYPFERLQIQYLNVGCDTPSP